MSALRDLTEFARHAFRAEFLTAAGVINIVWQACILVLVGTLGVTDIWQAIARTWNPSYSTGLPSLIVVIPVWGGIMLACIFIVGLLTPRR
jgi:hypothetical protein